MNSCRTQAIRLMVSGQSACFRRPEFNDDLITYDVMPPTVALRLLESIYAVPGSAWQLLRIRVLQPIRFRWDEIVTARGPRRALVLTDVAYVIEAAIKCAADGDRDHNIAFDHALIAGGSKAHLGLADYPAAITLLGQGREPRSAYTETGAVDLGWMLYTISNRQARTFFRATMMDGVINVDRDDMLMIVS